MSEERGRAAQNLLTKAHNRPELWYPTCRLRHLRRVEPDRTLLKLQQMWVSNHDHEEWRDIEIVDDVEVSGG